MVVMRYYKVIGHKADDTKGVGQPDYLNDEAGQPARVIWKQIRKKEKRGIDETKYYLMIARLGSTTLRFAQSKPQLHSGVNSAILCKPACHSEP